MQGVEILSQEIIPITSNTGCSFLVGVFVCFIIGVVLAILFSDGSLVLLMLAIGFCVGAVMYPASDVKTGEYIKYKVTISDDVPLNEFYERYEIINQEGRIYTIKEKEVK